MPNKEERSRELLRSICSLPKQMIKIHGVHNTTEFLLHHLAHNNCFNFLKAAYLIDNPDFNILKGMVGYHKHQAYDTVEHWENTHDFTQHMEAAEFNQKVRSFEKESPVRTQKSIDETLEMIAQELEIEHPSHVLWDMKYDNKGLLVFEAISEEEKELIDDHLEDSLHLFSFAPVF